MGQILAHRLRNFCVASTGAFVIAACLLSGCTPDAEIGRYDVPLDESGEVSAASPQSSQGRAPAGPQVTVSFDKPDHWRAGDVRGIRKAAFLISKDDQRGEATVIDLSASAGLWKPNVIIWRDQLKLGKCSDEELAKITRTVNVGGEQGQFVELVGPEEVEKPEAILAVMIVRGARSWFFKLKGDAPLVLSEKENFLQFVASTKFQSAGPMSGRGGPMAGRAGPVPGRGGPSMARPAPRSSPIDYDTPEGWMAGSAGGMRKAAFLVREGESSVEITLIDLAAVAGELTPNINRWREQIGLPGLSDEQIAELIRPVNFAGVDGVYVELLGAEDAATRMAILGIIAIRGNRAWFLKMMGNADLASREKERFNQFAASIRFPASGSAAPQANKPNPDLPTDQQPTKDDAPEQVEDELPQTEGK